MKYQPWNPAGARMYVDMLDFEIVIRTRVDGNEKRAIQAMNENRATKRAEAETASIIRRIIKQGTK